MKEQKTDLKEFLRRESVIPNQKSGAKNEDEYRIMQFGTKSEQIEEEKSPEIRKTDERFHSL